MTAGTIACCSPARTCSTSSCVHPFRDGNGRMARLLSLLMLHRAGYGVGRYVSVERMIEATRESYYDTLRRSSAGVARGGARPLAVA